MLTQTIPAYPYVEYADDDDIQAFFAAYNAAAQVYVTWFATIGLPFYPGLTGTLLNWISQGVYGLSRTSLQTQVSPAMGPLDTEALNTAPLNTYVFPVSTFYSLTDDVLGRILTWDFYKADGKRFCARWLKRRIMRFLAWPFGIAPDPLPGPENTQAISVVISGGVCTVTLNQALVSLLIPNLPPNLLPIFQAAFQGGNLDLPVQFTYVCTILTHPVAVAVPSVESSFGIAASQTTGSTTVIPTGGSGSYTFAWTWQSGGTGITINTMTAATTSFSASGLAFGAGLSGVARCTVTDTVTSMTAACTVQVNIARVTLLTAASAPPSLSSTGAVATLTSAQTNITPTGGQSPYAYAWTWQSGGVGITINSPTAASTTFTTVGLAGGTTDSGTALCTVTDAFGQTATATVMVSLSRVAVLSAVTTPTSITYTNATATETTGATTVTPSGGQVPYTYNWSWQSGGAGIAITTPTGASTAFTASGLAPGGSVSGTAVCVVKDAFGQTASPTCAVTVARATLVTASASPASQSSSALYTSQTTGASTVTGRGGSGAYTYKWVWSSGGTGIGINTPTAASTSFTAVGMTPGSTVTGVAQCTVTDGYGQTAQTTVSVSIACVTTTSVYTDQTAQSIVIPNGAQQVTIEGWAGGGLGGSSIFVFHPPKAFGGGGAGAGGYFRKVLAITSTNWGQTISLSATNAPASSIVVSSGTFTLATLTANPGANGNPATLSAPGTGGPGGTATGGDVNTTGGAGQDSVASDGGAGGTPVAGVNGGPFGGGGRGADSQSSPSVGAVPGAVFKFIG